MTNPLYSLFIALIDLVTRFKALWNAKDKRFVEGRKQVFKEITDDLGAQNDSIAWFHCASVGEFEQGLPLIQAYQKAFPQVKILVTFFSPSAEEAVKKSADVDFSYYLPLDYNSNANKFVDLINPTVVFFIKYEFWANYLRVVSERRVKLILASAIFRDEQPFFKWYGGFHRRMLRRFNKLFVQDQHSSDLLATIDLPCLVSGDTRFDRVIELKNLNKSFPEIERFTNGQKTMIVGSMRDEDEDLISEFIKAHKELKFVVAPHEINENKIISFQAKSDGVRFSQLSEDDKSARVLIIDNIGMLSQIYKYGQYAYVGGGFSTGIHNLLEPAVNEIPVFFGNEDYARFKEANDLIELGAGFPVGSVEEMTTVFMDLDNDTGRYLEIRQTLKKYVSDNQGAAQKIISAIGNN